MVNLVSQATPFTERGRVWSHCSWRVVTKECNYRTAQLDNHLLSMWRNCCSMTRYVIYEDHNIWLVTASFYRGHNSMVAAWPDPSSLCKGMACKTTYVCGKASQTIMTWRWKCLCVWLCECATMCEKPHGIFTDKITVTQPKRFSI